MKSLRIADATCAVLVLGMLLYGALAGPTAPERFPMHWNLSSAESCSRTHRAGGWVFVGLGLLTMATALVAPGRSILVMAALILLATLGLAADSYVVWRRDPDKVPLAGRTAAP